MLRCPREIDAPIKCKKMKASWFLQGDSGKGYWRIFCDLMGEILHQLAKEVRLESVVHAKLVALLEGLFVVTASRWARFHAFQVGF